MVIHHNKVMHNITLIQDFSANAPIPVSLVVKHLNK